MMALLKFFGSANKMKRFPLESTVSASKYYYGVFASRWDLDTDNSGYFCNFSRSFEYAGGVEVYYSLQIHAVVLSTQSENDDPPRQQTAIQSTTFHIFQLPPRRLCFVTIYTRNHGTSGCTIIHEKNRHVEDWHWIFEERDLQERMLMEPADEKYNRSNKISS
jgi:hypothetical protein